MPMLPAIPAPLTATSADTLELPRLFDLVAGFASTPVGQAWVRALAPSGDLEWVRRQQQQVQETLTLLRAGQSFDFQGLQDPAELLRQARIPGAALEMDSIRALAAVAGRIAAWQSLLRALPEAISAQIPGLRTLSAPLLTGSLQPLLRTVERTFNAEGTLADDASPELARIRRQLERQHRQIEESLRATLRRMGETGSTQEDWITVRGERFVIPVKAEWKRRIAGVVHGASSSGQTVFVEPLETIEQNNELQRLLEEEQQEIHRILAALTRGFAECAEQIAAGALALVEIESLFARARFAQHYACIAPEIVPLNATAEAAPEDAARPAPLALHAARHPLLEHRLRASGGAVVPLTLEMDDAARQLILSGPNTGGKTVALKTVGLLALMAQSGLPVPAESARLPLFDAVLADIGDAQSIEQNLSTFSAHLTRLNAIVLRAGTASLVLLDELGSATDPEEGAALAAAFAEHFVHARCWSLISTHHTSLKVYAANTPGVRNASAGFDEETLAPTYQIRVGVPGASAGISIAQRLGLDAAILANARVRLGSQSDQVARFLDQLHAQLLRVSEERAALQRREQELARERNRLELEGRKEQKLAVRALEDKLASLLKDLEFQVQELLRGVEDRSQQQRLSKQAERRVAQLRREFRDQFAMTVVAHQTGADQGDAHAQPHVVREVRVGDTVQLRSLGKAAVVQRQIDADAFEVIAGAMKMRVRRDDIAAVLASPAAQAAPATPLASARSKGIRVALSRDPNTFTTEINVIGQTVEQATDAVEKFLDHAFLEGAPRVRIVHGSGMGVLRKALRAYLQRHPHVATVQEPSQNEGGAGVTVAELRQ
jgi:DNA mismatch repair protein MutS2